MMRSTTKRDDTPSVRIDLAPMIDCVFLLLIFFIVTSVFVRDPGLEVERPDVTGQSPPERDALLIAIGGDDRIAFDGQVIQLEQVAALIRQSALDEETPVIVRADRRTSHGRFAAVYAEALQSGQRYVQFATTQAEGPSP